MFQAPRELTVRDELIRIAHLAKAARMAKVSAEIRKDAYLEDITDCVIQALAKLPEKDAELARLQKVIDIGEFALANPFEINELGKGQEFIQKMVDCAKGVNNEEKAE